MRTKRSEWLVRFVMIFISLMIGAIIAAFIAEWYFVHFLPQQSITTLKCDNCSYQFDPTIGYRYPPDTELEQVHPEFHNVRTTNSFGFHDINLTPPAPGQYRVMILGDSFPEGWQVDPADRFVDIARMRLPDDILLTNMAVGGFNTCQELGVLRLYGEIVQPDLVIVYVYLGNDLDGNDDRRRLDNAPTCTVVNGTFEVIPADPQRIKLNVFGKIAASHLARYIKNTFYFSPLAVKLRAAMNGPRTYTPLGYYEEDIAPDYAYQFNITGQILKEMDRQTGLLGARFLVVLIPDGVLADQGLHDTVLRSYGIDSYSYDGSSVLSRLEEAAGPNIEIRDLTTVLRGAQRESGNATYYPLNRHLLPYGHHVIADELISSVTQ